MQLRITNPLFCLGSLFFFDEIFAFSLLKYLQQKLTQKRPVESEGWIPMGASKTIIEVDTTYTYTNQIEVLST
ncbi:hypothetical protein CWR45_07805 [Oceanobacillus chungangensis]|uniref:Uncharacterized protein n=1 Tax=Oceanobacillus chungangensis TaxID=1229152 RepID=A0A3D8PV53_9BACI|nr:hypothetical protein CWR45_07805 [Oceanobacillus chungangensis]